MVIAAAGAAAAGVVAIAGKLGGGDKKKDNVDADSNVPRSDPTPTTSATQVIQS